MLIFAVTLIIVAFIAQRFLLSHTLRKVKYDVYPSKTMVEQNEEFEIISEIRNEKRLPELYIELLETLPRDALLVEGEELASGIINTRFYIMSRQKFTKSVRVIIPERGYYMMRDALLFGGDFFGTKSRSKHFTITKSIAVLPERVKNHALDRVLGGFLGSVSVSRFILPDPVLTIGTLEYTGREPMRDIHQAQSARMGRYMVKRYDYTLEPSVTVILNTEVRPFPPRYHEIEYCLSLARTVFETLEAKGIKYGFSANTISPGAQSRISSGDGLGKRHLNELLKFLSCASYATGLSFNELLSNEIKKTEQGRSHIIITPDNGSENAALIDKLRDLSDGRVLVLTPDGANRKEGL